MSTSLKARLEGKPRRRGVYLVQVADSAAAQAALARVDQQLMVLEMAPPSPEADAALERVRAARQTAVADVDACFVPVDFQALPDLQMERLTSTTVTDKGDYDRVKLAPLLAAACAVDEELRDVEWWTTQLASDAWSQGDVDALTDTLLELNWRRPPEGLPKG